MVINSINAVAIIFVIIGVGYFLGYKGILKKSFAEGITKIIILVALPCCIIDSFQTNLDSSKLDEIFPIAVAVFLAVAICMVIGYIWAKVTKLKEDRRGLFTLMFSLSNSAFIGFPVVSIIFGSQGMLYAAVFLAAQNILTNSIGFVLIKKDACIASGKEFRQSIKDIIKNIFSIPFIATLIGIGLLLLNIQLPDFMQKSIQYIGNLTSPLALIYIGFILYDIGLGNIKYEKGIAGVLIGRFLVAPAVMFCMGILFGVIGFPLEIIIVQMGLSVMVQPVVMAQLYGADGIYGTKALIYSTVLSLAVIPAMVAMIELII